MNSSAKHVEPNNVFSHTALPDSRSWIRLLKLHPSGTKEAAADAPEASSSDDFEQALHCSLLAVPIDPESAPKQPYKALSYCWGPNDTTHRVFIGGAAMAITSSLDSALRHFRHREEPIIIWIDQICINQSDTDEKSEQVQMMALVYSQAEQVLVWLGPADQGSDEAMELYDIVGSAILGTGLHEYCTRHGFPILDAAVSRRDPQDSLWRRFDQVRNLALELLLSRLEAVEAWQRRPWFGRVWVVQEFCVGVEPLFVCGRQRLPADFVKTTHLVIGRGLTEDFLNAARAALGSHRISLVDVITSRDPTPALFGARARRQRMLDGESGPSDTMLELLRRIYVGRDARATLPVDRVFSLLGLATDVPSLGIGVDYKRTAAQVLTDLARAIIQSGNLAILAYAQSPKDVPQLPSWVPDWRPNLRPSFYPYPQAGLEHEHLFAPTVRHKEDRRVGAEDNRTTSIRLPAVLPGPDAAVLCLGGFVVDTIERVGSAWSDDDNGDPYRHQSCLNEIRLFCRLSAAKNQPIYASGQRREQAEWRVPIADIWEANEPGGPQRATERAKQALAEFDKQIEFLESPAYARLGAPLPDDGEPSMYRLSMSKISGMRPIMTKSGYIGIGPPDTHHGDCIVIFLGSRVCSILRPQGMQDSVQQHLYIGEAYCDGIMDGELDGQRDEEVFYLV